MVGPPGYRDFEMDDPYDPADDGERRSRCFEHCSLLDVQLHECVDIAARGGRDFSRIEATFPHRLFHIVLYAADIADNGPRSPKTRGEARPLFLADREHLEGAFGLTFAGEQRLHRREPRDDAERAVESATASDGIDVRPSDDRLALFRSCHSAPDVANAVAPRLKPDVFHPTLDEFTGQGPGGSVQRPVCAPIRLRADGIEFIEPSFEQRTVNAHDSVSQGAPSRANP